MDITDLESSDKVKTLYVSIYGIENAYRQGFLGSGYPGYQNQDIVLYELIIMVNSRQTPDSGLFLIEAEHCSNHPGWALEMGASLSPEKPQFHLGPQTNIY